ncbi:MAG: cytochrome c oxidase accessory protein CcoG [Akkermansiaceae bacterium]|jgi:cytochrome c oxidase accessory protein FixG
MTAQKKPNLDSVTTVNADGSHHVLHPSDVSGRFTLARRLFAFLLLIVYVALPWITINEAPAVFFDVAERKFHLFGLTLYPQDLWVLFFAITGTGFTLFFITALLGRLWCGWACPYTIFLEHIFRRIERLIDGDSTARRKLDAAPWTFPKIWRRVIKHGLFVFTAAILAHIFLSYFVSLERLYDFVQGNPFDHFAAFGTVVFLTGAFYFCFAHFREQFCIMVCPYGRLQSAMTDDDTIIIGYDEARGEPRGKASDPAAADCIDCRRCVTVCPTGIDIRNGLQLECIGCAACIDACDDIMKKLERPTGLVRYDSLNGLTGKKKRILRPRMILYAVLGCFGLGALTVAAMNKAVPYSVTSSRMAGPPFFIDETTIRNNYRLLLTNKRNQEATFVVTLESAPEGFELSGAGEEIKVPARSDLTRPAVILISKENYQGPQDIKLKITGQPDDVEIITTIRFVGPNPASLKKPAQ